MDLDLTGKTTIVCGSTQGLGFASARELALLGASVVLVARNEEKLLANLSLLDASRSQSHSYLVADFDNVENVRSAINLFLSQGNTAQILVNNTGGPPGGKLLQAKEGEFLQAFNNHLLCNHVLATALIPGMKQAGFGRIINIISTSVKQPIPGLAVSNTIRAAVAAWSKTLASEVARDGITVNNVLPGFTSTLRAEYVVKKRSSDSGKSEEKVMEELLAEIPAGRMGKPEEFGAAVAFLCSPAAAYITGINLPVDGGRLACL